MDNYFEKLGDYPGGFRTGMDTLSPGCQRSVESRLGVSRSMPSHGYSSFSFRNQVIQSWSISSSRAG